MSLHGGIQARLAAQVSSVSTRVWRDHLPQDPTLPAITFNVVSAPLEGDLSDEVDELLHPRIEVWNWATTHSGAETVAAESKTALHKWGGTSDSTVFQSVIYDGNRDHYDPDLGLFAIVQDYLAFVETS